MYDDVLFYEQIAKQMKKKDDLKHAAHFWSGIPEERPFAKLLDAIDPPVLQWAEEMCDKGSRLLFQSNYLEASGFFRRVADRLPQLFHATNQLAYCHYHLGDLDEAIRVQREGLDACGLNDATGLNDLVVMSYIRGEEASIPAMLDQLQQWTPWNAWGCSKVCRTLGRFRRHQAVLDYAEASDYEDDPSVTLFMGIAAANLGRLEDAASWVAQTTQHPPFDRYAKAMLKKIQQDGQPHTVLGNWPYLIPDEVCTETAMNNEVLSRWDSWVRRHIAVDVCEATLNASPDGASTVVELLTEIRHPSARTLIRAVSEWAPATRAARRLAHSVLVDGG